jgi:hypothetical protein
VKFAIEQFLITHLADYQAKRGEMWPRRGVVLAIQRDCGAGMAKTTLMPQMQKGPRKEPLSWRITGLATRAA